VLLAMPPDDLSRADPSDGTGRVICRVCLAVGRVSRRACERGPEWLIEWEPGDACWYAAMGPHDPVPAPARPSPA
jgi:hypothetical protein